METFVEQMCIGFALEFVWMRVFLAFDAEMITMHYLAKEVYVNILLYFVTLWFRKRCSSNILVLYNIQNEKILLRILTILENFRAKFDKFSN